MKKLFALTVVFAGIIGLARNASSGPERLEAKEMVQPILEEACNWTGFYIGIHAGWGEGPLDWIDSDTSIFPDPGADTGGPETLIVQTASGFIGGVQGGYNYQWHWLVVGAEGEFSYADVKSDDIQNFGSGTPNHFRSRSDWQGTIAGRVGFAWKKWLFYGKGGGAFAHTKYDFAHGNTRFWADETRFSPMVGAGLEYMINCHWSAKLEYQHSFFGTEAIDGTNIEEADSGAPASVEHESYDIDTQQNSVRVGLNYKF